MYRFAINFFVFLCPFLFFGVANAEFVLCFLPEETPSYYPSSLQLRISEDEDGVGSVKYEPSGEIRSIKRLSEKAISSGKSVPATIKSTWQEMSDGREIGVYVLITRGAAVFSLSYVGLDGHKYKFISDSDCSSNK